MTRCTDVEDGGRRFVNSYRDLLTRAYFDVYIPGADDLDRAMIDTDDAIAKVIGAAVRDKAELDSIRAMLDRAERERRYIVTLRNRRAKIQAVS